MARRDRRELGALLAEHMGWIRTSGLAFDAGDQSEAKRIASAVRTLVHDTASSTSLLTQLGIRDRMTWLSSVRMVETDGSLRSLGLWESSITEPGYRWMRSTDFHECDFATWWRGQIFSKDTTVLSRQDFVLSAANLDGGSHVDPNPPQSWSSVTRGHLQPTRINSAGNEYPDSTSPMPAVLRTICAEIYLSIERS